MINAPLARAASTNFFTFGTESAQRLRRSGVQVCTVKSITSSAVSLALSVTGLSCGGAGSLTWLQSSMTVCARLAVADNNAAVIAIAANDVDRRRINPSRFGFFQSLGGWRRRRYSAARGGGSRAART